LNRNNTTTLQFGDPLPKIIPSLDGLRCISIIIVLASHIQETAGMSPFWVNFFYYLSFGKLSGAVGVQFFFIISGFLITYLLIREYLQTGTISFKKFYIRRVLRIFPIYYLYLLILAVLTALGYYKIAYSQIAIAGVYMYNFFSGGAAQWLLGHSWSLCVEEQFYMIWPLLFFLLFVKGHKMVKIVFALLLIAPILNYLYVTWFDDAHWRILFKFFLVPFLRHADHLLYGCLLAILISYKKINGKNHRFFNDYFVVLALGIVFCIGVFVANVDLPFIKSAVSLLFLYIIIVAVFNERSATYAVLNNKVVSYIGKISYGVYIYQQFFLTPAGEAYSQVWWRAFPYNLLLIFVVAIPSFHFYEKPILAYKKRFN